ncbi:MAG TPA: MinD/ParA family protein [Acidobacteriota bacterium]|nr:MinD/ParA family protein [Acidobacteriota bacterium]
MATETRRAHRIAVISGKGGVGKTVITANLAARLSSTGRRVLVVDADLGLANLDILLDVEPEFTMLDALHGMQPPEKVLVHTSKGFDLLPGGSGLPEGTTLTQSLSEGMATILSSIEHRYDVILFDAGAGVGDVVLFFANLADEILLVATPEPTSLMDSYATIKILNQEYGRNEFLLIVNQANPASFSQIGNSVVGHLQNVISRFIDSEQKKPVHIELVGSIPLDPAVPQAIRRRQLLSETSPEAPSTCLLNNLADYIRTHITPC